MTKRQLDEYELIALEKGGAAGGQYLDKLGKSDIGALDQSEWREFLRLILFDYEASMRDMVKHNTPPF